MSAFLVCIHNIVCMCVTQYDDFEDADGVTSEGKRSSLYTPFSFSFFFLMIMNESSGIREHLQ